MNFWSRIWKLSPGQLIKLGILFLSRPFLIRPTLKATRETMSICNELFGNAHHGRNKENAFRHALWNYKISEAVNKKLKNDQKSVKWTEKVTNLYENVTKNAPNDQKMDILNNRIGRNIFLNRKFKNEAKLIDFLEEMIKNALKIDENGHFPEISEYLIYINE